MLDEYRFHIKQIENISKALYQKNVVVDKTTGTVDVKMSASELRELAEVQRTVLKMKKEAAILEEELKQNEDTFF